MNCQELHKDIESLRQQISAAKKNFSEEKGSTKRTTRTAEDLSDELIKKYYEDFIEHNPECKYKFSEKIEGPSLNVNKIVFLLSET